jgi:hypothetical protein
MNCVADSHFIDPGSLVVTAFRMTDASMSPWRDLGRLVYAQRRHIGIGEFAVVALIGVPVAAFIVGRLVALSPTILTVESLNPRREIRICRRRVAHMLRVASCDDLVI